MLQSGDNFTDKVVFDDEFRRRFRLKRLELGLTQAQLAQFLNVSPSTIRKWEDGTVSHCHDSHYRQINRLLQGACDNEYSGRMTVPSELAARFRSMPPQMRSFIRKAAMIHSLSGNRADVRIHLQAGINMIIRRYAGSALFCSTK